MIIAPSGFLNQEPRNISHCTICHLITQSSGGIKWLDKTMQSRQGFAVLVWIYLFFLFAYYVRRWWIKNTPRVNWWNDISGLTYTCSVIFNRTCCRLTGADTVSAPFTSPWHLFFLYYSWLPETLCLRAYLMPELYHPCLGQVDNAEEFMLILQKQSTMTDGLSH